MRISLEVLGDLLKMQHSSPKQEKERSLTSVKANRSTGSFAPLQSSPSCSVLFSVLIIVSLSVSSVFCVHVDENTNNIYPVSRHLHKMNSINNKDSNSNNNNNNNNNNSDNKKYANSKHSKHSKRKPTNPLQVFYAIGTSENELPVCSPKSVCAKIDTYSTPWAEKQCRCPSGMSPCPTSTHTRDGHTVIDRTRLLKTCEPVKRLKRCKYFKDITWSLITYPDNTTQQIMHCKCPKNSVSYLIKRHAYQTDQGIGFQYSFACSPQTKIRCQKKEPCQLFSVRKDLGRPNAEDVTTNSLCQCPHRSKCPKHHLDVGVIPGKIYSDDSLRTYSGYCM